jgi:hypothetical protein
LPSPKFIAFSQSGRYTSPPMNRPAQIITSSLPLRGAVYMRSGKD